MVAKLRQTLSYAAVLALTTAQGCAAQQREPANPTAQRVQSQQQQSQAALDRANEAQKRASDQEKRATQAQEDVQTAQQTLIQAQQKARREQAKAEQLQREANALTREATQQATGAQQQATQSLSQQGAQVQQGQLSAVGEVIAAGEGQLVLQPRNGQQAISFRVTDQTTVNVDGQQASIADIQQGEDARVSYQTTGGTEPEALTIDVKSGAEPGGGQGSGPSSGPAR